MATSPIGMSWGALQRAQRTVVVVDVVESVRLIEQDEEDSVRRWQRFVAEVSSTLLPKIGGRLVKSLGDGLMVEFEGVPPAITAAFAMQQIIDQANEGRPPQELMCLRIGAHTASVIVDEHDIYGVGVNLAARLSTLAGPGEIVVSAETRDLLADGLDARVEDMGECYVKHIPHPIRAYRVSPPHAADPPLLARRPMHELRPTLAVIPPVARQPDAAHHYLGDALADEVIAALSHSAELNVISRLSTMLFSGRVAPLADIRTHLRADYALSGGFHVAGDRLHLVLELTEVTTASVVWADSLNGSLGALFSGEDALVPRIAHELSLAIMRRQMDRARTEPLASLASYSLLMAAVSLMHRTAPADFERARLLLEQLIERDRRHPLPYAWLAKWHVLKVQQGWSSDIRLDTGLALDATRRALDDDPHCALALSVDGFVHCNLMKDFDGASDRYEMALSVNPNEPLAWLFSGTLHAFKGEGAQAVYASERALQLSPLDPMRYFFESLAATAALSAGDFERAITLAQHSLRLNRTHTSTLRAITIAQVQLGRLEEARRTARALLALEPTLTVSAYLARSPSSAFSTGKLWSESLRAAGVPD